MSADSDVIDQRAGVSGRAPPRAWAIVGALSITEIVSWGVLYYAFAVFLLPMQRELGFSTPQLTGAFSLAVVISAVAGVGAGRYLDDRSPRALMTAGSVAGVLLVLAWSRVDSLIAFYAVWVGIGLVMATVLYEPAFVVLAKWFPLAGERRRALTVLTLIAALASFIFLPLSQALIDAHGWRDALVGLALILAAVTIPLHALVLRKAPEPEPDHPSAAASSAASDALTSRPFWLLSAAFFLATFTGIAMVVLGIPFLIERGYSAPFAAFAIGLIGISQIPGRAVFAVLAGRLTAAWATAGVFAMIAIGIGVVVGVHGTAAVIVGLVLIGMGNGMTTLSRATLIADRYGPAAYGTIGGVAAAFTTGARAAGPVSAAAYAALVGYTSLLWTLAALTVLAALLAYRAETM